MVTTGVACFSRIVCFGILVNGGFVNRAEAAVLSALSNYGGRRKGH